MNAVRIFLSHIFISAGKNGYSKELHLAKAGNHSNKWILVFQCLIHRTLSIKWIALLISPLVTIVTFAKAENRPNIILIVTDDQGYGDIAAHGNTLINTPHIDRLHSESIRFTNFHVDPTSAPTRAALMTGKYAHRVGVWHTVKGGNHLRASEITLPQILKTNGYKTAIFGKWHLGANYPFRPIDRGFESWLGLGDGGVNTTDCYFWNDRVNDMYWHNGKREYREGYNPDVFFNSAMDYIANSKPDAPFFIYLATYLPHTPYSFPLPDFQKKYEGLGLPKEVAAFYASIEHVDNKIGELRKFLADKDMADNTLLIFISDNGSAEGAKIFNAGMSGQKGSLLEGGHRVSCFMYYPNGNLGKARDINTLAAHLDILPTLCDWFSLKIPVQMDFDGVSLLPLIKDEKFNYSNRTLIVETQREIETNPKASTIMTQRWRLVGHEKLYDIQNDPGQKNDLAEQHPEVVKKLMVDFGKYWERVTPNDRFIPTPIAGTTLDEEIFLSVSEQRQGNLWNHGHIAQGLEAKGEWHIEIWEEGDYEIEVRRWPREASAPFSGIPDTNKKADAWSPDGPVDKLLYGGRFKELPVGFVSLKTGFFFEKRELSGNEELSLFNVHLPKGNTTIDAVLYDKEGNYLTSAYYVYVRKKR